MHSHNLGQPIPDTPHVSSEFWNFTGSISDASLEAVSVSLPTWKAVVGYEEGEDWVLSKLKTGYPRFFVHVHIAAFGKSIIRKYGSPSEHTFLFPSHAVAVRCVQFIMAQAPTLSLGKDLRIIDLYSRPDSKNGLGKSSEQGLTSLVSAVIFPGIYSKLVKAFWQHSGDGISSRRAEYCHKAFNKGLLMAIDSTSESTEKTLKATLTLCKGPRRYQSDKPIHKASSALSIQTNDHSNSNAEGDHVQFVEERFGRNLDMSLTVNAKLAIRRRIAGALTANAEIEEALEMTNATPRTRQVGGFSEDDVYLYPTGMSSIFNMHRTLMACRGDLKSVCFGFPYIDTLKVLEKWGPGCLFYGHGSSIDLDDLEVRCNKGGKYLAVFCEFPGNPLLKSPDLRRLRILADRYDFALVVDETIGNFMNVNVLPYADVVVSSLTKVFSGDSNVMGGSAVLNPNGRYYCQLREIMLKDYEDNYWAEDAIYLERNSRDFVSRIERINLNAEAICDTLRASPIVKEVYYPKYSPTRPFYDHCRNPKGGYGGLLSVTFNSTIEAVTFFDSLDTAKGPSLGTNFTISSPYIILAHYGELEWCAQFGVEADLVRLSVGLEDSADLTSRCERALAACKNVV